MSHLQALKTKKKRLRSHFRARRDGLASEVVEEVSQQVCSHLHGAEQLDDLDVVAGYMALEQEIDVQPFLDDCLERGIDIALPRVIGPGQMEFCLIDDWDQLKPGSFGIEEPTGSAIDAGSIDAFLVPGLAFDRRGQRLGFGKGYYDRALPAVSEVLAIGIAYHWQFIEDELPAEAHDRPMDSVVTDQKWHSVRNIDATSQE